MGSVWQLVKRWWTLMSCALFTILGTYAAYAAKDGAWIVRGTFVLAVVCAILAPVLEWRREKKKRVAAEEALASIPLTLDLVIEAIARQRSAGVTKGGWQHGDLFIQASAHLHTPSSVTVEYALDLIVDGVTTRAQPMNDLSLWHFARRQYLGAPMVAEALVFQEVPSLSSALSIHSKSDGWLHFQVADKSDAEITKSRLRLTATSPQREGMGCMEKESVGAASARLIFREKGYS